MKIKTMVEAKKNIGKKIYWDAYCRPEIVKI